MRTGRVARQSGGGRLSARCDVQAPYAGRADGERIEVMRDVLRSDIGTSLPQLRAIDELQQAAVSVAVTVAVSATVTVMVTATTVLASDRNCTRIVTVSWPSRVAIL